MRLTKKSVALRWAVLAAISSQFTVAEDTGWYVGGNIGKSTRAEIDDSRINAELLANGFTMTSLTTS